MPTLAWTKKSSNCGQLICISSRHMRNGEGGEIHISNVTSFHCSSLYSKAIIPNILSRKTLTQVQRLMEPVEHNE